MGLASLRLGQILFRKAAKNAKTSEELWGKVLSFSCQAEWTRV